MAGGWPPRSARRDPRAAGPPGRDPRPLELPGGRGDGPGPLGQTGPDPSDARAIRARTVLLGGGLVGLVGCLVVLGILADVVRRQEIDALDTVASPYFHAMASPVLDAAMNAASFLGSSLVLVPVAGLVAVALASTGRRREGLFIAVALGGAILANGWMKAFFQRPRPALPWAHVLPDYSFPSGHSMDSLALALALGLVVWRLLGPRWGAASVVILVAISLVIGVSRIYLGYHYLTDVVGGFAAAILWVAVVVGAFRGDRLLRDRWRRPG